MESAELEILLREEALTPLHREKWLSCRRLDGLADCGQQHFGGRTGRVRVLAGDQKTVTNDVRRPVRGLGEGRAELQHFALDQEGDNLREPDFILFAVGEAGHFLASNEQRPVGCLDVAQRAGGMTYDSYGLAGRDEGLDQLDRVRIVGEIPHWAVP
ncbi:MAG: hypothetical protein E6772_18680, partial [Dysgonomonas sp.]|nr:hypothetical protein [Dysgonomonas sp.]